MFIGIHRSKVASSLRDSQGRRAISSKGKGYLCIRRLASMALG
jgi:hypothetical protein